MSQLINELLIEISEYVSQPYDILKYADYDDEEEYEVFCEKVNFITFPRLTTNRQPHKGYDPKNSPIPKEIMDLYLNNWDLKYVISNNTLTERFMERFFGDNEYYWKTASRCQKLREEFIAKHKDKVNWTYITMHQKLSQPFMLKHKEYLQWFWIERYQKIDDDFIKNHKNDFAETKQ